MSDRLQKLEQTVEDLGARLRTLESRLSELLTSRNDPIDAVDTLPPAAATAPAPAASAKGGWGISTDVEDLVDRYGLVQLAGLSSLVLAGAMILRIVTMESPVPLAAGASLGLAYCAFLLFVAELKIRRGATLHGDVFATLSILILDALLVEVTRREGGFSREAGYLVLCGSLAVFSFQAIRRARVAPFFIALLAAPVAGLAIGRSPFLHPYFAAVLVTALVAAAVGMQKNGWSAPRWGPGILSLLYMAALGFVARAAAREDLPQHVHALPVPALSILAVFYVLHVLFAVVVGLFRPRRLDEYEAAMAVTGALVASAVAVAIAMAFPRGELLAGAIGVGLGLTFYVVAAISYIQHGPESGSFYPLTAIAFLYSAVALFLLIGGAAPLGAAYQALALALAVFASRYGKTSISFQAHLLTIVAFTVLTFTAIALAPPAPEEALLARSVWLSVCGVLTVIVFARLRSFRLPGERFSVERLSVRSVALVLVLAAGVIELIAGAVPGAFSLAELALGARAGGSRDALWFTVQTVLVVIGASATLFTGVRLRLGGVTALATALMVVAGLKVFLFDAFRVSGPHLVVSAAVFGVALITCSFIYRRSRGLGGSGTPADSPPEAEA